MTAENQSDIDCTAQDYDFPKYAGYTKKGCSSRRRYGVEEKTLEIFELPEYDYYHYVCEINYIYREHRRRILSRCDIESNIEFEDLRSQFYARLKDLNSDEQKMAQVKELIDKSDVVLYGHRSFKNGG